MTAICNLARLCKSCSAIHDSALLPLLCFDIAAQFWYCCPALLFLLSFCVAAQLCYCCSALIPPLSFDTTALLCYHRSALLPLLSFDTPAQQGKAELSCTTLLSATQRYSVILSNADFSESLKLKITSRTAIAKLIAVKKG